MCSSRDLGQMAGRTRTKVCPGDTAAPAGCCGCCWLLTASAVLPTTTASVCVCVCVCVSACQQRVCTALPP
jgi:hypothetical protein